MAKAKASKKQNKLDLENISERDRHFLTMGTKDVMDKYNVVKQAVYDRKFALKKKISEAGLSMEDLLNGSNTEASNPVKKAPAKKTKQKRGRKPKEVQNKPEEKQQEHTREIVKYEKPVQVIMKPIEITFETFSIKLNGLPKKISVNPETNSIEIDI